VKAFALFFASARQGQYIQFSQALTYCYHQLECLIVRAGFDWVLKLIRQLLLFWFWFYYGLRLAE